MPSINAFRNGFDLKSPVKLSSTKYSLMHPAAVEHVVKRQNREYEFPTTMQFKRNETSPKSTAAAFNKEKHMVLEAIKDRLCGKGDKKIIYSEYGSPYECFFDPKSFKIQEFDEKEHELTISCTGMGNRTFDIPSESQRRNEMIKNDTQDDVEELRQRIARAEAQSYRITKSHFNTGKCATCGDEVHVGEHIIQKKRGTGDDSTRGGWSHLDCLFPPKKHHGKSGHDEDEEASEKPSSKRKKTSSGPRKNRSKPEEEESEEESEEEESDANDDEDQEMSKSSSKHKAKKTSSSTSKRKKSRTA